MESKKPFSTAELVKLRANGAGRMVPQTQRYPAVLAIADFATRENWKGWSPRELKRARKLAREIERKSRHDEAA